MRTSRLVAAILIACSLPLAAYAQTAGNTTQMQSLMTQLQQLEQQIQLLSGQSSATSSASTSGTQSSYSGICPVLSRTLALGSTGNDVANLQAFLAGQGLFSATVTGYYGTITQTAVAQWQESRGIVSGGDANSTGLGVVGPRTRSAIGAMCGQATGSQPAQCLPTQPPTADCPTGWQPVNDAAGCAMYYQCSVSLPSGTNQISSTSTTPITSCPVVVKPSCSGTVQPFQTNASGCVTSYICVL